MADAAPLSFTLRDVFQKVFPTVIALCLFIPFVRALKEPPGIEEIIFAGVVLSYLIAPPMRKVADFLIIEGNPLTNIAATRNIRTVIQGGKVMNTAYDPTWVNPVPRPTAFERR